MNNNADALVNHVFDDVIRWRRHIHANPDLSFHEKPTADYIHRELNAIPHLEITRPLENSVIATLKGKYVGPVQALRADIDALPLDEKSGVDFASTKPGIMHACGHDAHTAMLMGAIKILSGYQDRLHGTLKFIFQPAEEIPPGGAKQLVEMGIVDDVAQIFGLHVQPDLPVGTIVMKEGPYVASSDNFNILIKGKGGHGSMPHTCVDPVVIGAEVVCALQHIVARNTDPLLTPVLTVATFQAGDSYNVIPDSARLAGTLRTHNNDVRQRVPGLVNRIVEGITHAHGADCEIEWQSGYAPGFNHPQASQFAREQINAFFPAGTLQESQRPLFSSEDFSSYQEKVPGCFIFIGCGNPEKGAIWNVHNPHFIIDEEALKVGIKTHLALASALINGA
ncbi:amidohydrolase [Entomohabitans teleogrylli]|uniref:amidohydrolase n=1 Tax=Entomohabitans teleogrylli TaxID=1384589 RepID=UPI00073D668B|nr:amidohydrolase [Entomohabitans teleogrylli]